MSKAFLALTDTGCQLKADGSSVYAVQPIRSFYSCQNVTKPLPDIEASGDLALTQTPFF